MKKQTTRRQMLGVAASLIAVLATSSVAFAAPKTEEAVIAAGCFWSMEAIFKELKGVQKVEPGYAGGSVASPSYEAVETGKTGHAEALRIAYDPNVISYSTLIKVLLTLRNPTTIDRQGNDIGPHYRSVIFYKSPAQKKAAEGVIASFTKQKIWANPIVTKVSPYKNFYSAEDYHYDYYAKHPNQSYCKYVIAPEIEEFHEKFASLIK